MASLTYMIYIENTKDEVNVCQVQEPEMTPLTIIDPSDAIFSSFRSKSVLIDPNDTSTSLRISVRTIGRRPPKLRDLIQESGILAELERDEDLRSMLEEEVDEISSFGTVTAVDRTLRYVMDDVLTMDDQDPFPCTCSNGKCIYHSTVDETSSSQDPFETVSIPSPQSMATSFDEIPHYCTPQFEPQYLIPPKVASSAESRIEETIPPMSQPSRCLAKDQIPALERPPLTVEAQKRKPEIQAKRTLKSPEEADDIVDSSHAPLRHISGRGSTLSYCTMVSEITLPYEMASPFKPGRPMKLDPRAPQFQMAQEQGKQNATLRTRNRTALPDEGEPMPQVVRSPPKGESPGPPIRKQSTALHTRGQRQLMPWSEHKRELVADEEGEEEDAGNPPLQDPKARKGSIGSPSAAQPYCKDYSDHRFKSPVRDDRKAFEMPRTPSQDSNPLLYPGNLLSTNDEPLEQPSNECESIVGPFISPGVVKQRYRLIPGSPQLDSNPLLFPQGIEYYPPSPVKGQKARTWAPAPSGARHEQDGSPSKNQLDTIHLPLETTNNSMDDDYFRISSITNSLATATATTTVPTSGEFTSKISDEGSIMMLRVKLSPRVIMYVVDGQERIHTGFYSGPIDRFHRLHGNGVFWYSTGDLYLGQFVEGRMHGVGILAVRMEDGSKQILRGFFRNNEFVGAKEPAEHGSTSRA